jgi:hypothetical protein
VEPPSRTGGFRRWSQTPISLTRWRGPKTYLLARTRPRACDPAWARLPDLDPAHGCRVAHPCSPCWTSTTAQTPTASTSSTRSTSSFTRAAAVGDSARPYPRRPAQTRRSKRSRPLPSDRGVRARPECPRLRESTRPPRALNRPANGAKAPKARITSTLSSRREGADSWRVPRRRWG